MAENEVGRVSLGVELSTDPLSSQAADLERKVTSIAEKAGEKAGKKFADEAAKAFEKNADKIGEAGEKAGEEAGKGAGKGLKSGSKKIETETGAAGEKAGKSFFSRFQKNASGAGGGLKALAGKIGKALVAAFAVKKIFDFGKLAVNLGSDLNEVQNVVDSTFGQGSDAQKAVDSFAKNAANQFGLSETMAKRYSGTFGAMGKAFGFTSDQAADMGTTLAGLSGDVASFYNITQDEAYTKLKSVFTGETESLKDLGVVMTQTALDQYALSHGLGTTTAHMSEQQKVALRYQFVLDKLSTASGDFARTSGSWANQVRLLKLQFESLAATIGQVLIAALTPAIRALNAFMGVLVKAANTFKSFVFSLFGLEASAMGTGSAGALPEALGNIGDGASGAADSLGDMGDAAKGAGKDASKAADEIKRSLASFDKITKLTDQSDSGSGSGGSGGGGGSGGSGGGGGAGSLGDTSSALTNTAWSVGDSGGPLDKIIDKLKALKDMFVGGFWEGLSDLSVFDSIQSNIESIGQHLKNIFTDPDVVKAASDWADTVAYNLGRMAGATVSVGATIVDNITGGIAKYLEQHEDDIKQALIRCFDISGEIYQIAGDFSVAFADVFSVFRSDDAKQITADLINIFATGFDTVVETTGKVTRDILNNLTKPFIENKDKIKSTLEGTIGQISTVVAAVSDTVEAASRVIGKYYDDHVKPLLDSLGNGISQFLGTFLDGWNKHIKPVLDELANKFADVCEAHIIPMMESLGEAIGSVVDLLKALWENILQPLINWAIKNIMPVLGDMAEALGGALLTAITVAADGIKSLSDAIKPVIDFITGLINAIGKIPKDPKTVTITGKKDAQFDIVKAAWESIKDKTAEIKAKVNEFTDNLKAKVIDFKANMTTWGQELKDKVINFRANMTTWGQELKDRVINFKANMTSWGQDLKDKVINFKAKMTSWSQDLNDKVINFKARMNTWSDSLSNKVVNFKAKFTSWSDHLSNKVSNFKAKFTSWSDHLSGKSISGFKAKVTSWSDHLSNKVLSFKAKLTSWFKKDGGVYSNGKWSPIQRYATGGSPDGGQLFVAREAGPELVGTLGGHTAVMNNNQIVASVSSGVAKAISGIKFYARGNGGLSVMDAYLPRLSDIGNGIRSDTAQLVAYAKQMETAQGAGNNAEVLELLRRILEILMLIDPDVYIDGEKVTSKIVSIINAQTRASGRSAIIV